MNIKILLPSLIGMFVLLGCDEAAHPVDNHFIPEPYSGWIVIVFNVPGGDPEVGNPTRGTNYEYSEDGVSLTQSDPKTDWRRHRFFSVHSGSPVQNFEVAGQSDVSGTRQSVNSTRSWTFLCSWVGHAPTTSPDVKISIAIAKAEARSENPFNSAR